MNDTKKTVPKLRFPEFTDEWEQRKLGDISKRTYGGGTPKTAVEEYWNGDIPWIQSSNVIEEELFNVEVKKHITDDGLAKSAAQLIPKGSIAVVSHVGVGKLVYMPYEYTTSQDFISLADFDCEPDFFCYSIYNRLQRDLHVVQGSAIKGITKADLLEKEISVPSNEEQKKIGTLLHDIDNTIALHQRKLEAMKEYKKGLLQKMFPKDGETVPELRFPGFTGEWEQRKLNTMLSFSNGFNGGSEVFGSGTKLISVMDILNNPFITYDVIRGEANVTQKECERFKVEYGDVLFQRSSENVEDAGSSNVYLDKERTAIFGGFVIRGKKESEYNPVYMKYLLDSKSVRKQIMSKAQGAQHINVSQDILSDITVFVPDMEEQDRIDRLFRNIENTITLHQRKLDAMKEYKKGLLQQMFC